MTTKLTGYNTTLRQAMTVETDISKIRNIAIIARLEPVPGQLVLDQVVVKLKPAHAQALHDRVVAIAGVDQHRVAAAKDQEAVDRHPPDAPAFVAQHQKAGLELDIAIIEQVDRQCHRSVLPVIAGRCPASFQSR